MPDDKNNTNPAPVAPPVAAPQPVQQWQQAPPENVKVQYVVQQQSLDGIGGWLAFWLAIFAINGIVYAGAFFALLGAGITTTSQMLSVLFYPVQAVVFLAAVVLISMRKKLGMWVSMAAIGLATLYSIINVIVASSQSGANVGAAMGTIVMQLLFGGLVALYFFQSKRVKATLTQ